MTPDALFTFCVFLIAFEQLLQQINECAEELKLFQLFK